MSQNENLDLDLCKYCHTDADIFVHTDAEGTRYRCKCGRVTQWVRRCNDPNPVID